MGWSTRRIHKLLDFAQSRNYLEIGVYQGQTFHSVNADLKVGVDPDFKFDTGLHASKKQQFFSMSSDRFFANYNEDLFFDVIFLDGFHEFGQTYRDLINSLDLLSPGGFILIDDVWPVDQFSYLTDFETAGRLRFKEALERGKVDPYFDTHWHGDVFKVVPMIHDFHKTLQYRTLLDGNAQTVVWFDQHEYRENKFPGISEISNLQYWQVLDNKDILRTGTEAEVWKFIESTLV